MQHTFKESPRRQNNLELLGSIAKFQTYFAIFFAPISCYLNPISSIRNPPETETCTQCITDEIGFRVYNDVEMVVYSALFSLDLVVCMVKLKNTFEKAHCFLVAWCRGHGREHGIDRKHHP